MNAKAKPQKGKNQKKAEEKFWQQNVIPGTLIFLTGLLLYVGTYSYKYVLDDKMTITDNIFTNQGIAGIGKIFSEESFTGYFQSQQNLVAGSRYRPLSMATFAIERSFFESQKEDGYDNKVKDANGNPVYSGNPAVSHIINAILYGLTGLLLFRVLHKMFPPGGRKWFLGIPFAAAIIFITHPIHTEVVANIKGRDEILALFFSLASVYFMLRMAEKSRGIPLMLAMISFFLALLSKESAVVFLAIIPLTVYFFTQADRKVVIRSAIALGSVFLVYLMIRINVIGHFINKADDSNLMNNPFYGMNAMEKISTIVYTFGLYIKLLFWPHPLTSDYYPFAIPVMTPGSWQTLISAIVILILAYLGLKGFRKKSPISYSIFFFFIALFPVSNLFFTVGTFMNERFIYIPSVAFAIAFAWLFIEIVDRMERLQSFAKAKAGYLIILLTAIMFSFLTLKRLPAWKDNYTLFATDVVTSSNSAFSNCFMGVGIYQKFIQTKDENEKKRMIRTAVEYEKKSLAIYPEYDEALHNMSGFAVKEFEYDQDINKFLNTISEILVRKKNKTEYIDSYMLYMNGQTQYREELIAFYHRTGYELLFRQHHKNDKAKKYLEYGLQIDPGNRQLNEDLTQVERSVGY